MSAALSVLMTGNFFKTFLRARRTLEFSHGLGQERTTDTLPNAHEKGVALRESFQRNAMKKGGEHECAAAGFPFIGDIGGSGCDTTSPGLGASRGARDWADQ